MFKKTIAVGKEEKERLAKLIDDIEVVLNASGESDMTKYTALKLYTEWYQKLLKIEDAKINYSKT